MPLTRNASLVVAVAAIGVGGYLYLEGDNSEVETGVGSSGGSALAEVQTSGTRTILDEPNS